MSDEQIRDNATELYFNIRHKDLEAVGNWCKKKNDGELSQNNINWQRSLTTC